jgi:hypothetical protein
MLVLHAYTERELHTGPCDFHRSVRIQGRRGGIRRDPAAVWRSTRAGRVLKSACESIPDSCRIAKT